MKVAISSTNENSEALVHPQFGRCDWFIIYTETPEPEKALKNSYADLPTGAGIGCAQDLIQDGVKAVIAGQFGPKAYEVLQQGGVEIYLAPPDISVQKAYKRFLANQLPKMEVRRF